MSTRATPGGADADPRDDWLAGDAGDLDWFPEDGEAGTRPGEPGSGRASGQRPVGSRSSGRGALAAGDLLEGRGLLIAIVVGIVAVAIVAYLVFGGGSSTPPATTQITTTPPTTTTPAKTTTPKTTPGTAAIVVTLPPVGYLKSGDTGAQVKSLQQALVALGIAKLTVDGNFGPGTASAVTAFQQANNLTADGVVGAKTADAINAAVRAQG